jgi:hypothetical protein
MATLYLDSEPEHSSSRDLHDWLGGASAILFSNPEDFQSHQYGSCLAATRMDFGLHGLKALAVNRDAGPAPAIASTTQAVWLREPPFAAADPVSFAARTLRGELLTARARFVMLIDGSLKRRAMFKYSGSAVATTDLLAALDAMRGHRIIGGDRVIGKAA